MPRKARIVLPGLAHHIAHHGNNRQKVFFVDDDYRAYLRILAEQSEKYGLTIHGYCLMTNHIHLIATPQAEDSLALAVGRTHFTYTQAINRRRRRSGHLWQNRFYSCALDETHFWRGLRYVELNPVRAKMKRRAWTYRWSSAALHCDAAPALDPGRELLDLDRWARRMDAQDWKERLSEGLSDDEVEAIRSNTNMGRPLGSDRFMRKLERRLDMRLRPLPVGRPRKE